ncbi:MAG TPA: hypothetical protein VH853_11185 [Polyangia bacterium]|nr:hypothetical protein [Polyangia bacterium]
MSTRGRLVCAVFCTPLGATLLVGGCGAGSGGGETEKTVLTANVTMLPLNPDAQGTLVFTLKRGGSPVSGQTVSFATMGPSSSAGSQGATVAPPMGVTSGDGTVLVSVRAGLADFVVEAQSGTATAKVTVIVAAGANGTVVVAPFLAPSSRPLPPDATLQILFYDSEPCAALNLDQPPDTVRGLVTLSGLGDTHLFPLVGTMGVSSAVGQAISGSAVVAQGCVDIPGSSLLADGTVEVALPLTDVVPDPVGTYTVTSTLMFAPPLAAAAALGAPWADLSNCPLDPAQLWLDCTVDALLPATAADPLDCVPSAAPGGEGPLGDAIAALRGLPLVDGTGAPTGCRSARDAAGDESVDALALGLFGSPTPPALVALPAIAADAADMLDSVRLGSQLTVAPTGVAGSYVVTHTLSNAQFGTGWPVSVPLASLGLPSLQAFASATLSDAILVIGGHSFTLRLGTAARAAFGPLSLVPRGFPADTASFVSALFAVAHSTDGAVAGCPALDGVICPAVGQPAGCVTAACTAGLAALANELDGAFDGADGTGLDLSLSGSAPLIDNHGDGLADNLGQSGSTPSAVATWSVNLRTSLGSAQVSASFDGMRN